LLSLQDFQYHSSPT